MYSSSYTLMFGDTQLGDTTINIPKDQFLKSAKYIPSSETLQFIFEIFGDYTTLSSQVDIPVSDLVHEYEGGDGINVDWEDISGPTYISIKVADPSETNDNKFINLTSEGLGLFGITDFVNSVSSNIVTGYQKADNTLSSTLSSAVIGYVKDQFDALKGINGITYNNKQISIKFNKSEDNKFINLTDSGLGLSGITTAFTNADNTLSSTLSAAVASYVSEQLDVFEAELSDYIENVSGNIVSAYTKADDQLKTQLTDYVDVVSGNIVSAYTKADEVLNGQLTDYIDKASGNIISAYIKADDQLKTDLTNYVTDLIIPSGDSIKTTSNLNYITTAESVIAFVDEKINTIAPEFEIITEAITEDVPYNRIRITEINDTSAKAEFIQSGTASSVSLSKAYTNSIYDAPSGYLVTVKAVKDYYESQIEGLQGQIDALSGMIKKLQEDIESKLNS